MLKEGAIPESTLGYYFYKLLFLGRTINGLSLLGMLVVSACWISMEPRCTCLVALRTLGLGDTYKSTTVPLRSQNPPYNWILLFSEPSNSEQLYCYYSENWIENIMSKCFGRHYFIWFSQHFMVRVFISIDRWRIWDWEQWNDLTKVTLLGKGGQG